MLKGYNLCHAKTMTVKRKAGEKNTPPLIVNGQEKVKSSRTPYLIVFSTASKPTFSLLNLEKRLLSPHPSAFTLHPSQSVVDSISENNQK